MIDVNQEDWKVECVESVVLLFEPFEKDFTTLDEFIAFIEMAAIKLNRTFTH